MTKIIQGLRNLPYKDRLNLNLHSLERRRARGDMIEVFKWVKGINKGNIDQVLEPYFIHGQIRRLYRASSWEGEKNGHHRTPNFLEAYSARLEI